MRKDVQLGAHAKQCRLDSGQAEMWYTVCNPTGDKKNWAYDVHKKYDTLKYPSLKLKSKRYGGNE